MAERAVRRIKGGRLLQYCSNPAWTKRGGLIPWNVTVICKSVEEFLSSGTTPYERRFGEPFSGPIIPCGWIEYHPLSAEDQSKLHQVW